MTIHELDATLLAYHSGPSVQTSMHTTEMVAKLCILSFDLSQTSAERRSRWRNWKSPMRIDVKLWIFDEIILSSKGQDGTGCGNSWMPRIPQQQMNALALTQKPAAVDEAASSASSRHESGLKSSLRKLCLFLTQNAPYCQLTLKIPDHPGRHLHIGDTHQPISGEVCHCRKQCGTCYLDATQRQKIEDRTNNKKQERRNATNVGCWRT